VTALGDTLYPVDASSSGPAVVVEALDSGSHFLRRLRGYHPILAFLGAGYLGVVAIRAGISAPLRNSIIWVLTAQMIAGLFNVFLSAPGWLQVVHLGLAQSLWILWIWGWFNVAKGGERKSTS
jgi:heme A synthase